MSKFKVGDKVRVIDPLLTGKVFHMEDGSASDSVSSEMKSLAGRVVTVCALQMGSRGMKYKIKEDGNMWFWVDGMFSGLAEPAREFIVLRRDGQNVIASYKRGDEIVKSAKATCNASDTFVFETGAKLAFDRLVGREEPRPEPQPAPAPKAELYTGKVVCVKDNYDVVPSRVGMIFTFVDGELQGDKTRLSKFNIPKYRSFDEFCRLRNRSNWIEVKD